MFRNDGFSSFPYLLIGIGVGKVVSKGKEWIGRQSESIQFDSRHQETFP